ncbi:MAG: IclR family transcriptional regulator [Caulobacter sp.]|nr:IclR family transcriptional regulator [Caulobacter sp.]
MSSSTTRDEEPRSAPKAYSAPALERGFNVIELLAQAPRGLTASEIAAGLELSIGEIFRIIVVMERRRWLNKDPDTDQYTVNPRILEIVFRATPAEELTVVAGPYMRELSDKIDQSCHLVMPNGRRGLVVLRQQNPGDIAYIVRLGADLDLVRSCSGQVLLAFGDEAWVEDVLDADGTLQPKDRAILVNRLKLVRSRGFEMRPSARVVGVTAISYPIFGLGGRVIAALTVPFLVHIDGSQVFDEDAARAALALTSKRISMEMGWFESDEHVAPLPMTGRAKGGAAKGKPRNVRLKDSFPA